VLIRSPGFIEMPSSEGTNRLARLLRQYCAKLITSGSNAHARCASTSSQCASLAGRVRAACCAGCSRRLLRRGHLFGAIVPSTALVPAWGSVSGCCVIEVNTMTLPAACTIHEVPRCRSLFAGQERDSESGNDYFGARYSGSNMGRWMSPNWDASPSAASRMTRPATCSTTA